MNPEIVIPEVIGVGLAFAVVPAVAVGASSAFGPHPVTCPDNGETVTVRVGLAQAAKRMFTDANHRVRCCSRWPERAGCDRACESSIVA